MKLCNVLEYQDKQIVYKKYASLYFVIGASGYENELSVLEAIHHLVESLDKFFGNVCELDLIYNFHKVNKLCMHSLFQSLSLKFNELTLILAFLQAYYILDEIFLGGNLLETSSAVVLKKLDAQARVSHHAIFLLKRDRHSYIVKGLCLH